jgi:NAD(P)-dependent dehydrogenase (short-subunit alcohol dehydrogenase family)
MVHGCRSAIKQMRSRGGTIINVGSMVSDRAAPLQGAYNASKHAVKGYTDTLRMELEHDGIPIAVTLVKPAAIDTPFFEHARSYMTEEPAPPRRSTPPRPSRARSAAAPSARFATSPWAAPGAHLGHGHARPAPPTPT